MQAAKAHENRVRRQIRRHGAKYQFIRAKKDEFGQPVNDDAGNPIAEKSIPVMGLFHETGSHFMIVTSEAAKVQTTPHPAILAMLDDAQSIAVGDQLTIPPSGGIWYKVTAVNDIGNAGVFADISLEVIADGSQF